MNRPDDGHVHFSNLKRFSLSPAHYKASFGSEATSCMRRGSLVHALILDTFDGVVWKGRRTTKKWKSFEADNDGRWIVTAAEMSEAKPIAYAVRSHPIAAGLLFGSAEHTWSWDIDGRSCKGSIDVLGGSFINEIKTTRCAKPEWFMREALRRKYHSQVAWYLDGLSTPLDCYITAVESSPPYAVTVLQLTERVLEDGRARYRSWWEQLRVCEASDEWPSYSQSVVDFDISDYGMQLEETDE